MGDIVECTHFLSSATDQDMNRHALIISTITDCSVCFLF